MNWLSLVAISALSGSAEVYVDNYISDCYFKGRGAVSQKLFFAVGYILAAVVTILFSGFDFLNLDFTVPLLLVLAGICSSLAGIPYYKTLEIDDSTNLGIFMQTAPILYLVLGCLFLNESISPSQLIAFAVIMAAPLLIILNTRKRSRKTKLRAVFYAFLYVLIEVVGNLIFVKENTGEIALISSIALLILGKGIGNVIIMAFKPKWIKRFKNVVKSSEKKVLIPLFWTFVFSLAYTFSYRIVLVLAPSVALASALLDSAEPITIFFMGIILTLIWPKLGREKLNKKSVLIHLAATVLVVIGIILLQIQT